MPITHRSTWSSAWRACLSAGSLLLIVSSGLARTDASPAVGVVRDVTWSPGDTQREGASEFEVFLTVAQLQQASGAVGLVGVGNHNGRLSQQAERALEHVACRGIAVARVARGGGAVALTPDALYVDAGSLPEAEARELLLTCLQRYGAPPAAANPADPTEAELTSIRRHLSRYQEVFATARSAIAMTN
jgi:tRNA-dihydrouridine synthase